MNGLLLLSLKTTSDSSLDLNDHNSQITSCWSSMSDFDKKCLRTTASHEWLFSTSNASNDIINTVCLDALKPASRVLQLKHCRSSTSSEQVSAKKSKSSNEPSTYSGHNKPDYASLSAKQIVCIDRNKKNRRGDNIEDRILSTVSATSVEESIAVNKKRQSTSSSFKGVVRVMVGDQVRWRVKVVPTPHVDRRGREIRLSRVVVGEYPSEDEAARAYDQAVRTLHGPSATTNYHEDGSRNEHAKRMKLR
jgi:hypothetical protein